MKKLLLLVLLCSIGIIRLEAACSAGYSEVIIQIIPDAWPTETSWNIQDSSGVILYSGTYNSDTVCLPAGSCSMFSIFDSFGDGIFLPGGYWVYVDGVLVASGNAFGSQAQHFINCLPGSVCSSPLPLTYGTHVSPFDNTWYLFTAPQTGIYNLTTCFMNTCDTKIWIYTACNGIMNSESPAGTYAFNDDSNCGIEADLDVVLMNGQTYYIRIGDNLDGCLGTEIFTFNFLGPVTGCMDPLACNFNPMATVSDSSCIYFPDPACTGPDLKLDSASFVSSLVMMTITASGCDIDEGCLTGYGDRYVISFTSKIDNIGTLDYYIGNPGSNPTMFNTVNCHGHAHYDGYGDYRLYDTLGNLVPAGHKNGFCVMDLCGFGQYNCGDMGISAGCYDAYGVGTQCQWIDITNVPDGDYRLAAIINQHHLPDALNHYEINHINNALQICINITRDTAGVPSFTVLPTCTPYVDCMGIPGGAAMPDCNGICGGPSMYGNINGDLNLDSLDVLDYTDYIEMNSVTVTSCNDLNGDGLLTIFDAALAMWCFHSPNHPHPAGSNFNACNFPRNILNPNDSAGLAITSVNFTAGYLDIEMLSPTADVKAFQFSMHGIDVSSVISLASPVDFPCDIRQVTGENEVFAISQQDSAITRSLSPQPLCRIFFSAVTDTIICIDTITEIINQSAERTVTYEYGGCVNTSTTSVIENNNQLPLALIPNPVSEFAFLQIPSGETPESIEIIDMTGKSTSLDAVWNNHSSQIDMSGLQSGLYLLKVRTSSRTGTLRFVKYN